MVLVRNFAYLENAKKPPLIEEALLLLNICGLHPLKQNLLSRIISVSILLAQVLLDMEILAGLVAYWDGMDSMFDVTLFFGLYQVFFKILALIVKRQKLIEMLLILENFWQFDDEEVENIYNIIRLIFRFVTSIFVSVTVIFCFTPVLFRKLVFKTYHPVDMDKSPDYEIMFSLQFYGAVGGVIGYYGCEILFIFFIICIACEFRVIKEKIRKLPSKYHRAEDQEKLLKELGLIINQHNLVLRFINEVNDCFSLLILNHSLSSVLCISTTLVTILVKGMTDAFKFIRVFAYGIAFLCFFFLYCFFGTVLTSASESVADGIFESNWADLDQEKFKKACIMITLRSQKEEKIKAAGMFDLNLPRFTSVCNSALSFMALFRAVYNKDD